MPNHRSAAQEASATPSGRTWFFILCTVAAIIVQAGCRSPGSGMTRITPEIALPDVAPAPSEQKPLIVLGYLARVEPSAENKFLDAYGRSYDRGTLAYETAPVPVADKLSNTMVKSLFFATELRRSLITTFGDQSVVLLPTTVALDGKGSLVFQSAFNPPAEGIFIFLDFARCDPYRVSAMSVVWENWDTAGWMLRPNITAIVADATLNSGIKLSRLKMIGTAAILGALAKQQWLGWELATKQGSDGDSVEYASFDDASEAYNKTGKWHIVYNRPTPETGAISGYSAYKCDSNSIAEFANSIESPSPFQPVWARYANIIAEIHNSFGKGSLAWSFASYADEFDANMGAALRNGALSMVPDGADRNTLLNEFLKAETAFLWEQDDELCKQTYDGDFGMAVRQLLLAESQYLDGLVSTTNNAFAVGMLTFGATAATGMATSGGQLTPQQQMAMQLQMFGQAQHIASQASADVRQLQTILNNHYERQRETIFQYTLKLNSGPIAISAKSFSELRSELSRIYQLAFPNSPPRANPT